MGINKTDSLIIGSQEPCAGCEHFNNCRDFELACKPFSRWVKTGSSGTSERTPNNDTYRDVYRDYDNG